MGNTYQPPQTMNLRIPQGVMEIIVEMEQESQVPNGQPILSINAQAVGIVTVLNLPYSAAQHLADIIKSYKFEPSLILRPPNTRREP